METNKETIQNNTLLAKFLGEEVKEGIFKLPISVNYNYSVKELNFHNDWNWLMLVVDKINTFEEFRYSLHIYHCRVTIYDNDVKEYILEDFLRYEPIDTVYYGCIEFVKWYFSNQNLIKTK